MTLSCRLYVDGEFEGVIHSEKDISVGKNGHIKGDVIAQKIVIQGYLEGTISAQKVEIRAEGKVNGTIESSELIIEAKGIFEGNSVVKDTLLAPVPEKLELNKS